MWFRARERFRPLGGDAFLFCSEINPWRRWLQVLQALQVMGDIGTTTENGAIVYRANAQNP